MQSSVSTCVAPTDEDVSVGYGRLDDLLVAPGSWSREARTVLTLASERGVRLDDESLIYSDVRDLITLERGLRRVESAGARHLPRELRGYVCA